MSITLFIFLALLSTGCARNASIPEDNQEQEYVTNAQSSDENQSAKNPREAAAVAVASRGREYIKNGKPDSAIRELERAINLDPSCGDYYYYMAEAWLMKKNRRQAKEFNRLAVIYLENNEEWQERIQAQINKINKLY